MALNERLIALFEDHGGVVAQYRTTLELEGYSVPEHFCSTSVAGAIALLPQLIEIPVLAVLVDRNYPDGKERDGGDKIAAAYAQAIRERELQIALIGIGGNADVKNVDINFFKDDVNGILDYLASL